MKFNVVIEIPIPQDSIILRNFVEIVKNFLYFDFLRIDLMHLALQELSYSELRVHLFDSGNINLETSDEIS